MTKKRKDSSLETLTRHPATFSSAPLSAPRRSPIEIAVSDDGIESCQLPSHQLDVPFILVQDSIAGLEPLDLEPIPKNIL